MSSHCRLCDKRLESSLGLDGRCDDCSRYRQPITFDKMLEILEDHAMRQIDFNETYRRCKQFEPIIETYPLYVATLKSFDFNRHSLDRIARDYKLNYLAPADSQKYKDYCPIELETINGMNSFLQSIIFLCFEDASSVVELRVRNIVDMILNADTYIEHYADLSELQNRRETWQRLIIDSAREDSLNNILNSITNLSLYSLSNILNVNIVSICPQIHKNSDHIYDRLHRTFSPLPSHQFNVNETPVHILWTSKQRLSALNTSSGWLPDHVVPLLPAMQIQQLTNREANDMYLNIPDCRRYRTYRCGCIITQSTLDSVVTEEDQKARLEAEANHRPLPDVKFQCPKCLKFCTDYQYDLDETKKYRESFTRACYTYILIDKTPSMAARFTQEDLSTVRPGEAKLSRFDQTKIAVRVLLKKIAVDAGPMDKIVVNTFDNRLAEHALIQCDARDANSPENLSRLDAIKTSEILSGSFSRRLDLGGYLSKMFVRTHFYEALTSVYQLLEQQAFNEIRLHVFSDGEDTSGDTENIEHFRNIVKLLHQQIGVDCAFVQCGTSSANIRFSNFNWLVDRASISAMSGSESMILEQSVRLYQQHYPVRSNRQKNVSRTPNDDFNEGDHVCRIRRTRIAVSPNQEPIWSANKFPEQRVSDIPRDRNAIPRSQTDLPITTPKSYMFVMGVRHYRRNT